MKLWITKYALSAGILEVDAEIGKSSSGGDYVHCKARGNDPFPQGFYWREFHRTLDEAKKDAERRRIEKIASLKKQIKRLENLTF